MKTAKLFCVCCRREIPLERLVRRPTVTCGERACSRELARRRLAVQEQVKCAKCGAPSTPQERREFKAWRKSRGEVKKRGRKPKGLVDDPRQMRIANELTIQ